MGIENKLISGKKYRVMYEIKNYVKGGSRVRMGNSYGTLRTANGIYTEDLIADGSAFNIYSYVVNGIDLTTLDIDNIHIYEIPEWTASGNHSCDISTMDKYAGTGSLKITASGAGSSGSNYVSLPSAQIDTLVSGNKYTLEGFVKIDPTNLSYGSNLITNGVDWNTPTNGLAQGWTKLIGTAGAATTSIVTGNGFSGNAQRLEVTTAGDNIAIATSLAVFTIDKVYKVSFKYRTNKTINVLIGASQGIDLAPTNTDNATDITFYVASKYTASLNFYIYSSGWNVSVGDWFEIDNVSVQEANPVTFTKQIGTKSVTITPSVSSYTKFVLNFEATASEVNQDLKMWLSGAGSVYVDKLSLTQSYDIYVNTKVKDSGITRANIISNSRPYSNYNIVGYELLPISTNIYAGITDANAGADVVATRASANNIANYSFVVNRTDKIYAITNGSSGVGASVTKVGKMVMAQAIAIGARFDGADKWNSLISHIQIIRFENISQSTFNSALTGLQFPTGGGAEEVLRVTFQNGSSITECLKDYSPKGHTVSGILVDITNRKRVTS